MKRAVILMGTDGLPNDHWHPWLKAELEKAGYEVFIPLLPDNHTPDRLKYDKFLQDSNWDFADNLVIGHSSGATTALNLMSANWFPHVRSAVLVGTFLNLKLVKNVSWYVPGQFDKLFLNQYEPDKIKAKADKFYFVHGDDDPYCDITDAQVLCDKLRGTFITIPNGHHLGDSSGLTQLPDLTKRLSEDGIL